MYDPLSYAKNRVHKELLEILSVPPRAIVFIRYQKMIDILINHGR